jgi:Tol biopolymer transport system component
VRLALAHLRWALNACCLILAFGGASPAEPKTHDRWPAFSPDGKLVAFERSRGSTMDVYVIGVDGRNLRRITRSPAGILSMSPAWLPDGRLIYTTTTPAADYPDGSLYEVSAFGGDEHVVGPAGARERSVSPDGRTVLFLTKDWRVAKLDLVTGKVSSLSQPPNGTWDTEAAWSPDGKRIAFGCNLAPNGDVSDICAMNGDGSSRVVLVPRSDAAEWVTWSPDGTHIAFQADTNNFKQGSIVVVDLSTGRSQDISAGSNDTLNETPSWSPTGDWIAFQVKTDDGYRIALVHPDGSGFHRLT